RSGAQATGHFTQLPGHVMQVAAGHLRAFDVVLIGTGNGGQLGEVTRDVLGYRGLFLGGGGDLLVHVANGFHRLGDTLQHGTGLGDLGNALFAALLAALDGAYGIQGAALHGIDDLVDLGGGLAGALGELAYLVGDRGQPQAPRAGRTGTA